MRKTKQIQLMDGGTALTFNVTQMSATQQQSWLLRAGLLLSSSAGATGIKISRNMELSKGAFVKLFSEQGLGLLSAITPEKVQPLLDDLLHCCARVIGNVTEPCTAATVDGYISDFTTLFKLQSEAFKVNFGDFFTSLKTAKKDEESQEESSKPEPTLKIPRS